MSKGLDGKHYGKWVTGIGQMPVMSGDNLLGTMIHTDKTGRPEYVEIQFETADTPSGYICWRLEFSQAMALFSHLHAAHLDAGFPMPPDPRGDQ